MKLISNSQVLKIDDIMPIGQQKILIRVVKVRAAAELAEINRCHFTSCWLCFFFLQYLRFAPECATRHHSVTI